MATSEAFVGFSSIVTYASSEREEPLDQRHRDEQPATVEGVGEHAAHEGEQQQRSELREEQHADERRRLEQVVGEGAEDHVLHPAADVRQERADEHPPEHRVPQGGSGGAGSEGAVAVLQRVDGVFDGLVVTAVVGRLQAAWPSQDAIRDANRASPYRDPPMAVEFEEHYDELELPFDDPVDVAAGLRRDPRPARHVPVLPALRRGAHARARALPLRLRLARLLLRLTAARQ